MLCKRQQSPCLILRAHATESLVQEDELVAAVKKEAAAPQLPHYLCSMVLHAVEQNKRTKEREAFVRLLQLLRADGSLKKGVLQQAFVKVMGKAVEEEMWEDAPRLWANLGGAGSRTCF